MNWKDWYNSLSMEKRQEYNRKKYLNNRVKILRNKKLYRENNKELLKNKRKDLFESHPWLSSFYHAKQRCIDKNCKDYKNYGGRGIKFLMTKEDFKYLWNRDKGWLLENHSIDRINNNGNYELSNCRFIERSENSRKSNYERKN